MSATTFSYWSTFSSVSGVVEFRLPRHKKLPNLDLRKARNQNEFCSHSSLHLRTQLPSDICSLESPTRWKWHSEENNDKELTDFSLLPAVTNTQVTHHSKKLPLAIAWWCGPMDDQIPGEPLGQAWACSQDKNCELRRLSLPDPKLGFKICGGLQKSASWHIPVVKLEGRGGSS